MHTAVPTGLLLLAQFFFLLQLDAYFSVSVFRAQSAATKPTSATMFSVLEAAAATQPAAPAPVAAPEKPADAKAGAGGGMGMGGMGAMLGGAAKGGFTGGTKKDQQMNSLMNFFTNTMNSMFGSMAPKKK